MNEKGISLAIPVEERIAWAEGCYSLFRDLFLLDEKTRDLLERLATAIVMSHREMEAIGIAHECSDCEEHGGGSCCGAGLENKYDGFLLLINVFLGTRLPRKRFDERSCFFLGEKGCLLSARHVICVNYLCKKVTDRIDSQRLTMLKVKEGVELELLFHLHERMKGVLRASKPKWGASKTSRLPDCGKNRFEQG
jgi:hypothetical protein